MVAWLLGTLLVLILVAKAFTSFGLFGALNFLSVALRLTVVFLFGIACMVVWITRRTLGRAPSNSHSSRA